MTKAGEILSVYRDRSPTEIRDISLVRLKDGGWSQPKPVANDGWEISGCPVNGPAIDAIEASVAVAWFTAANEQPAVKVAFSTDGGETFETPLEVNIGNPLGRVDILMRDAQSAMVSWVEYGEDGETIMICSISSPEGCVEPIKLITINEGPSIGFPRMAMGEGGVFLAWTAPLESDLQNPQADTKVRMVFFQQ